jgi:redox-sensitive bicupin YhaK (pirin superfamily)
MAVLSRSGDLRIAGRDTAARVLLVAGQPLNEAVTRYGPFVMNTPEEIHQAIADFRAGKF